MNESRHVLKDHPCGSHFAHEPQDIPNKSGTHGWGVLGSNSRTLSGDRDVLTRETSRKHGNVSSSLSNNVSCKGSKVIVYPDSREVLSKHTPAKWVNLAKADGGPPHPMSRQTKRAYTGTGI
jgi:hypothetical protein